VPKKVRIEKQPGYVTRDGDKLHFQHMEGFWDAPALARITITDNEIWASFHIVSWIIYPDLISESKRDKLQNIIASWHWRSLNKQGKIRKGEFPDYVIRKDRMIAGMEKLHRQLNKRLDTADMLFWLMLGTGGFVKKEGQTFHPTIRGLAKRISQHRYTEEQIDNVRNRDWQEVRPVIHLCIPFLALLSGANKIDKEMNLIELFTMQTANTDWQSHFLKEAETLRIHHLPALDTPVLTDQTIQFHP
jgi:hypothetical protein